VLLCGPVRAPAFFRIEVAAGHSGSEKISASPDGSPGIQHQDTVLFSHSCPCQSPASIGALVQGQHRSACSALAHDLLESIGNCTRCGYAPASLSFAAEGGTQLPRWWRHCCSVFSAGASSGCSRDACTVAHSTRTLSCQPVPLPSSPHDRHTSGETCGHVVSKHRLAGEYLRVPVRTSMEPDHKLIECSANHRMLRSMQPCVSV